MNVWKTAALGRKYESKIEMHEVRGMDFLGGSVVENLPANVGNTGSILGSERSPGEGNGSPLQYSCSGNPMDTGAWRGYSPWGHMFTD